MQTAHRELHKTTLADKLNRQILNETQKKNYYDYNPSYTLAKKQRYIKTREEQEKLNQENKNKNEFYKIYK